MNMNTNWYESRFEAQRNYVQQKKKKIIRPLKYAKAIYENRNKNRTNMRHNESDINFYAMRKSAYVCLGNLTSLISKCIWLIHNRNAIMKISFHFVCEMRKKENTSGQHFVTVIENGLRLVLLIDLLNGAVFMPQWMAPIMQSSENLRWHTQIWNEWWFRLMFRLVSISFDLCYCKFNRKSSKRKQFQVII